MHKCSIQLDSNCRYMSVNNAMIYTGLGRNTLRKLAEEADASRRVGKRVLIDKIKPDEYIDKRMK